MKADEVILREAILDVIDDGNKGQYWKFYLGHFYPSPKDKSEIDFQRLDFADAVVVRVQQLKQMDQAGGGE